MKLGDEILKDDGDRQDSEKAASSTAGDFSSSTPTTTRLTVGYALTAKKRDSFLQPKLLELARLLADNICPACPICKWCPQMYTGFEELKDERRKLCTECKGILFAAIDENQPLSNQGPFDVILHKLAGKDWCQALEDYGQQHPNVTVIDPPAAIRQVQNRQSMLEKVAVLNLSLDCGVVSVPRQMVCTGDSLSIADEVTKEGLEFPLVSKPLIVDGSAKSHEMFLAYDKDSLVKLEPPLVLQEFINHGGVLFKVYIIGESIKVVKRLSLPDVIKQDMISFAGVYGFPRVSCASATADDALLDPRLMKLPPMPLLERLAKELRIRLGLQLFNIDMIRQHGSLSEYYVIDINYFPGYGKTPEYEHNFTDFLLSLEQGKCKRKREEEEEDTN